MTAVDDWIADTKTTLELHGYTVQKTTSYRRAQERQRIAQNLAEWETERREHAERWARDCLAQERRYIDRLNHVYAVARAHGATDDELADDAMTTLRNLVERCDHPPVSDLEAQLAAEEWTRAREMIGSLDS